ALVGSNVAVSVDGGTGTDNVNFNLTTRQIASKVYFASDLGAGNDKFIADIDQSTFINYGTGSEVHFDVNGGLGTNVFTVTRNGTTGLTPIAIGALFDIRYKGGAGVDTMTVDLIGLVAIGSPRVSRTVRVPVRRAARPQPR